jgi:hypothetical protein
MASQPFLRLSAQTILQFTRTTYDALTGAITIETDEAMRKPRNVRKSSFLQLGRSASNRLPAVFGVPKILNQSRIEPRICGK